MICVLALELSKQLQETAKKGQKIIMSFNKKAPVLSDQNVLRVIVTNLLSNTIKYSQEGKKIWLNCLVTDNELQIEMKDEDVGIPKEDQANMFECFFEQKTP